MTDPQRLSPRLKFLFGIFRIFISLNIMLLPCETFAAAEKPLQAQGQMIPIEVGPQQGAEVRIHLHLPEGYRAYSDMFQLTVPEDSGFKVGQIKISPLHDFFDVNSKKTKKGVIKEATLVAPVEAPGDFSSHSSPLRLRLTYQACTKTFCLFPTTLEIPIEFTPLVPKTLAPVIPDLSFGDLYKKPFQEVLKEQSLALAFLVIFLAGFLTSLTPCVFPMIPITMAIIGREAHARSKTQTFFVSLVYVLGIALTYSILGLIAASTGALFGSFMNSPWVLGGVCLVFLAMALSMLGLYDLQAPPSVQNKILHANLQGYWGVFLTGALAGVVASPCVGPVLVGILTYVAQTKNLWIGFWALFIFALGMGQLFLILGMFSSATRYFPKSGAWMSGVKHFFGLLMLFAFYNYLQLLVPVRIFDAALGLGAILLGSLKGAFEHPLTSAWQKVRKGLCHALILIGGFLLVQALFDLKPLLHPRMISESRQSDEILWQTYSTGALEKANLAGQPVIVDFFADWCAACKELDKFTFADPRFHEATKNLVLLKFDATKDSPEMDFLRKKFKMVGLPTVIFYDSKGEWRQDLTLTAFEETPAFLQRIESLLKAK